MDDKKIKKTVRNASITLAVTAGTAIGIVGYNRGNGFIPALSSRDFNFNQVHFSGDNDVVGQGNNNSDDDSQILEKDDSLQSDEIRDNPGYVFDGRLLDPTQPGNSFNIINTRTDDSNITDVSDVTGGQIYDVVGNGQDSDVTIAGGQITGGNTAGQPGDNPGTGGNTSITEDGENQTDLTQTAKDPQIEKPRPGMSSTFDSKPYDEDIVSSSPDNIMRIVIKADDSYDAIQLYKGQSVDAYTIFCSLDTYVVKRENDNPVLYLWGKESYDRYIRISSVSFDGGQTWNSDFPMEIPFYVQEGDMLIDAEYRFSVNDEWISEAVDYTPKDSKLYILSESLKTDNEVIDSNKVINYDQYPEVGSVVNLYQQQRKLYSDGEVVTSLFPGWEEGGRLVPWMYKAGVGRHILQPAKTVPLDRRYKVVSKNMWMNEDGKVDASGSQYCALQTLVDVSGIKGYVSGGALHTESLSIPEYIQAVEFETGIDADYISIPDSVIYINNGGNNLTVKEGYNVSQDNPNYASDAGVLLNKEETRILAVPYNMENLVVNRGITSVNLKDNNNIKNLELLADDISELPDIDFDCLDDCRITVKDSILEQFILDNYEEFASTQNVITTYEQPDVTYKVVKASVINNSGELCRVIKGNGSSVVMSDEIGTIGSRAFDDASNVKKIIMSSDNNIVFEKDCLKNSSVETILCDNASQRDDVISQLAQAGKEDINVYVTNVSTDGYTYYSVDSDNGTHNILVKAPEDIVEFNGKVENDTIVINEIDSECFAECRQLVWVELPENVVDIGYEAFRNCISLQGVLIGTTDTITIGNKAFSGCDALRFVASDAMNAVMEDDYDPVISDSYGTAVEPDNYFFILSGATGYGEHTDSLKGIQGVTQFRMSEAGGSRLLYGVDAYGEDYIMLRSGRDISGAIELTAATMYIHNYAFADAGNQDGFTINWDELEWLFSIQTGAFYNSGVEGSININGLQGLMVYDKAFALCTRVENASLNGNIYYIGEEIFSMCSSLKSVELGEINPWGNALYAGMFNGCDNLETVRFDNEVPPQLVIYGSFGFQFNYSWTRDEEARHIKLIVPEGTEERYVLSWRYAMCGYTGVYYGSPYLDMWNGIQGELIDWDTFTLPTDEEVDAVVRERLLDTENYIRIMTGQKEVEEPTAFYPMRVVDGYITLIETPSYIKDLDLSVDEIGLPEGWFIDYIGSRAFEKATGLEHITIADNLVGIYSDAFAGTGGADGTLTIDFMGDIPVQLIAGDDGTFSFGISYDRITVIVPQGSRDAYIDAWSGMIDKEQLNQMIKERESVQE